MNIIDSLKWRYATKNFDKDRIVSHEKLNILFEAFNLTATSYGLQPIKLLVIQDKNLQQNLVACSMNQKQVAEASHVLVFCLESVIDKVYIENYFKLVKSIRNTPNEILDPFKNFLVSDFENKSQNKIKEWSTKQAYIALGNLMTVCALEGIDACPMEGFEPEKYDEILNLKSKGLESVLVLPIGYRDENDYMAEQNKVRKKLEDSVVMM
ncbi:NAD(P)H-dependent oxidoreductase [Lacinutrix jangbogonensis]|uniref:NAD(P)H-dependent oxidoreductase n=1 Tax=Lacinutrix jangbogonensis TaxID=1469557 RepID=UPI00053F0542|nr:NAD(P)H-dependent oxidoreductase [Lacinutrix jangbogonensis]